MQDVYTLTISMSSVRPLKRSRKPEDNGETFRLLFLHIARTGQWSEPKCHSDATQT